MDRVISCGGGCHYYPDAALTARWKAVEITPPLEPPSVFRVSRASRLKPLSRPFLAANLSARRAGPGPA